MARIDTCHGTNLLYLQLSKTGMDIARIAQTNDSINQYIFDRIKGICYSSPI